ncbi:thiol reductase thioredoxin [Fundicoccus sp. Sow4_F4]|uniref:thiol reductase thioredoxin n=1 Tax=Fundicoccus sp. Sow4_F4 TaxID=3438783 RepID=UPI003F8F2433
MSEIEIYLEEVKAFEAITPMEAETLIEAKSGHIVYIGRETCPYCRRFVAKLSKIAKEKHLTIHYVHAQHPEYTQEILAFRNKYEIASVPGFLYSDEVGIKVKCDSSMTPEDILTFVNA